VPVAAEEGAAGPDLREAEDRFLACWAGAAGLWGVSPTHARLQGLLFLARRPLDAEAIERRLRISHGSCSTGLGNLVAWGAVRRVAVPGSRRMRFAADPDGWKWLRACIRERRRRDLDPVLAAARETERFAGEAAARAGQSGSADRRALAETGERARLFLRFLEEWAGLVDALLAFEGRPPTRVLRSLSRAAAKAKGDLPRR
jgi:DNA-binding transcriptional regulator GbsR (MarR family)